jgi:hypothetical protein
MAGSREVSKGDEKVISYEGCFIKNIHRGKVDPNRTHTAGRDKIIYASLYAADGTLLISADIDYIAARLHERIPK